VQPIYIAAPIFPAGQADFLPVRCGLRAGAIDEVVVPDETVWARDRTPATPRGEGLYAESVDAALELMGDPPEFPNGQGFHAPIDAAFKAATREFGSELDQEVLLAQVEAKLRERIGRRGDAYLDQRIRDARPWLSGWSREARNAKHAGRQWRRPDTDCPPTFLGQSNLVKMPWRGVGDHQSVINDAGLRAAIQREVRAATKESVERGRDP
jgi:hypothetical protein